MVARAIEKIINKQRRPTAVDRAAAQLLRQTMRRSRTNEAEVAVIVPATVAPLAPAAVAAIGTSLHYAREDHVHPLPGVTPSAPSSSLETAWRPSTTKAVLVVATVKVSSTNPLDVGSSTSIVQLLSDAANPPTTERGRVDSESSVGGVVGFAITAANTAQLCYLVPAGHYVLLTASGTGTHGETLVSVSEIAIG